MILSMEGIRMNNVASKFYVPKGTKIVELITNDFHQLLETRCYDENNNLLPFKFSDFEVLGRGK